jgi:parallel beta-helix repeat protein
MLRNVSNAQVESCRMSGSNFGMVLYNVTASRVILNNVSDNPGGGGIQLITVRNSTVADNLISRNDDLGGNFNNLELLSSHWNLVTNNRILESGCDGIYTCLSTNNMIARNLVRNVTSDSLIWIAHGSEKNIIENNTLENSTCALGCWALAIYGSPTPGEKVRWNVVRNNTVRTSYYGIDLHNADYNDVESNNFTGNVYGVAITRFSSYNNITRNRIEGGGSGAAIGEINPAVGNTFTHNYVAANNLIGVRLEAVASGTQVHHNTFVGNNGTGGQATDNGAGNFWNTSSLRAAAAEGNRWSDYSPTCQDTSPADGICDIP